MTGYVNNNFEVKHYTIKLLVDSDHLTVICGVSFKGEERVNYWKLNTQIRKSSTVVSELKEEITRTKALDIFTNNHCQLWDVLKSQVKKFFKYKSCLFNKETNEKYNKIMMQYIKLKLKSPRDENEENFLDNLKR